MKKRTTFLLVSVLAAALLVSFFLNKVVKDQSSSLKKNSFSAENEFKSNLAKQLKWTPETVAKLHEQNIRSTDSLGISYFFYTDDSIKAERLADELKKLNYQSEVEKDFLNQSQFLITGKTTALKISNEILLPWTKKMCEIGFSFDCDFDGWEVEIGSSNNKQD